MGDGKTDFLSGDQVKGILARAEDMITQHIPAQHNFIQAKREFDTQANKFYPSLFKAGSNEQAEYRSWLTVFPECQRYPDIALIVGDAMVGRTIRLGKAKATGGKSVNGNGNNPLATPSPASAPKVPKSRALSGNELQAIATNPDGGALDAFVSSLIENAEQKVPSSQRAKR
jgi:hypothetical protein